MKVALLCGGPSLERGISLNSARTIVDHLDSSSIEVIPIYFNQKKNAYVISKAQIYSNTPSDFDFKLSQKSVALSEKMLVKKLKDVDIVFPAIHGSFGEDGRLQKFLEKNDIPFVGAPSETCSTAFDKYYANNFIRENSFFAPLSLPISINSKTEDRLAKVENFFKKNKIKKAVVKPAKGGSSIGVFSVSSPSEVYKKVETLFSKRMGNKVVIEPFAEGREFTSIIVENRFSLPVCILPTEIETDYTKNQIFDFRKKYLPTAHSE